MRRPLLASKISDGNPLLTSCLVHKPQCHQAQARGRRYVFAIVIGRRDGRKVGRIFWGQGMDVRSEELGTVGHGRWQVVGLIKGWLMDPLRWLLHVLVGLRVVSAVKGRCGGKRNDWAARNYQPRYPVLNDGKAFADVQSADIDIEKIGHFLLHLKHYIIPGGWEALSSFWAHICIIYNIQDLVGRYTQFGF